MFCIVTSGLALNQSRVETLCLRLYMHRATILVINSKTWYAARADYTRFVPARELALGCGLDHASPNLALISALEMSNQVQYLSNHSTGVCRAGGQEKWTPNSQRWPARIGFQVHGSRVQKADLAFHSSSSTLPKSSLSLISNSNRTHRWTCCNLFHSEVHQNKLTRVPGFRL